MCVKHNATSSVRSGVRTNAKDLINAFYLQYSGLVKMRLEITATCGARYDVR
jgi:hypothetical protein